MASRNVIKVRREDVIAKLEARLALEVKKEREITKAREALEKKRHEWVMKQVAAGYFKIGEGYDAANKISISVKCPDDLVLCYERHVYKHERSQQEIREFLAILKLSDDKYVDVNTSLCADIKSFLV